MAIGHQYFCSKWYISAKAMTPLHGGAATGLEKHDTTPFQQYQDGNNKKLSL